VRERFYEAATAPLALPTATGIASPIRLSLHTPCESETARSAIPPDQADNKTVVSLARTPYTGARLPG